MFGHIPELIVVLVLALIFFGPEKLPEIAASAGKMVGELRAAMDSAMQPDTAVPDDEFATYYYESLQRSDADVELEDLPDPNDEVNFANTGGDSFHPDGDVTVAGPEHDLPDRLHPAEGSHAVHPGLVPDDHSTDEEDRPVSA